MLSMDSRNLLVVGSAAAAVIAGAYVLWGPSAKPKRKRKGTCPGLVNFGNTCFLNAILQAMAPCGSVVQWMGGFTKSSQEYGQYLAATLHNVLRVLNNDSIEFEDEYVPSDVISALQARRWVIPREEQDAHELFHVVTETLDEEASRYPQVLPLFEAKSLEEHEQYMYQTEEEARSRIDARLPVLPRRQADHPFRGLLASQLKCKRCNYKYPVKYDTFDSLSLTIPSTYVKGLSLDHLMKQFIMSEMLQNVHCEGCAKNLGLCPEDTGTAACKGSFVKKLTIGRLPQCLCLHVQRTVWQDNGMPMKRVEHVTFPEVLNMSEYVYRKRARTPTSLPLATLESTLGSRLVGGRNKLNGYNKIGANRSPGSTSPTLCVPYSGPVNLLKALNYHSRTTMAGLCLQPSAVATPPPPRRRHHRRQNDGGGAPGESSSSSAADPGPGPSTADYSNIQRLASAYSTEALASLSAGAYSYRLAAVVVHLGDVFSGHFVTYRRAPSANGQRFPERWLYTSDTMVRKASLAEVLRANAYMIFYEKC